jgi:sirohydrochlorin cobaltochelatase
MAGEDPCKTLEAMRPQTIHIIPLFMCDGYYTRTVIPKKLKIQGSRTYRDGGLLIYGSPIGVHPEGSGLWKDAVLPAGSHRVRD